MTQASRNPIAEFLDSIHLGSSQNHKQLTFWSLIRSGVTTEVPYICLAEALACGGIVHLTAFPNPIERFDGSSRDRRTHSSSSRIRSRLRRR